MSLPQIENSSDSEPDLHWADDDELQKYSVFRNQELDVPDEEIQRLSRGLPRTNSHTTTGRSGSPTPGRSGSPTPGPSGLSASTPRQSGSPTPGRSGSPTPGRSGSPTPGRSGSPTPGPSTPSKRTVPANTVGDSSSDSDFDPEIHSWKKKNHKRQRIAYKNTRNPQKNVREETVDENHDWYDFTEPIPRDQNSNIILENDSFEVKLEKIAHSRHTRFNLSDHLYNMQFKVKSEKKEFLMASLFEMLDVAFTRAIDDLKKNYDNSYKNQLYSTIIQKGLLNGLNTGGYSMATPSVKIVSHLLNMLESYLQSHENLTLDSSFKVQFKVITVSHVTHRIMNDPAFVVHVDKSEKPGCEKKNQEFPSYIFSFPSVCYEHSKKCFENLCFILTLVLSLAKYDFDSKNDLCTYNEIITFKARQDKKVCRFLHEKINYFVRKYKDENWKSILDSESKQRQVQFHIFDADLNFSFFESIPTNYSPGLHPIYLCYFNNQSHLTFITNYGQFCQRNRRYYCFFCGKYFQTKQSFRHRCQKSVSCFACCRPLFRTSFNRTFLPDFCDSEIVLPSQQTIDKCLKCNMLTTTESCRNSHKQVCSKGVKFECCGKYLYKSSQSSISDLMQNHVCSEKKCPHCLAHYNERVIDSHQCVLKPFKPREGFPILGFFLFEKENSNGNDCFHCLEKGNCYFHKRSEVTMSFEPAHCTIYIPKSKNAFQVSQFSKYENDILDEETIFISQSQSFHLPKKPFPENMLKELKIKPRDQLNLLERLLKFISEQNISGMSLLCFCEDGSSMMFILDMLVSSGITPKIINKNNFILFLHVVEIDLRFLNLSNFLPFQTLSDITNAPLFPVNFINALAVKQNLLPTKEDFFSFSDSVNLRAKKEFFAQNLELKNWNFFEELMSFMKQKMNLLIHHTYLYVQECRSFQELAFKFYKKEFRFIHPFQDNVSKNGYIYHLYQYLELNSHDIRAIPKEFTGISDKTSQPEMEYCQYIQARNPNCNFIDAWSPYGQKRFKSCIPDAIDETNGTYYFFMGCYHHAHNPNICPINCKGSEERSRKYAKEFDEKTEKLKNEYVGVKSVILMWECEWQRLKKEDPEVKQFMQHTFVQRPKSRLIPRDACKLFFGFIDPIIFLIQYLSNVGYLFPTKFSNFRSPFMKKHGR